MTCPSCGAAADPGARFCASCGASLAPAGDERRVVTVLFADMVGFTTMAEPLDPETVKNLIDRWFERLAADITEFGGRVDKVVGDAIVALFGAPVAHEDDAERAVRAALRMQETLAAMAETDAGPTAGSTIRMRIGVNTGEVLVGALRADGAVTAMGDVVNTASRLQTSARPGEVMVGGATQAATRRRIRYEPRGLLAAKGREERVEAWVAKEPLLPPGARTARPDVPLVGRDAEVRMLHHAVESAVRNDRALLVVLVGDAGLGKTRLAAEVGHWAAAAHGALAFEGRCVPYGEANVWWPVAEALRQACYLDSNSTDEDARTRTLDRVAEAFHRAPSDPEVVRVVNGILHLMGHDSPLRDVDAGNAREEAVRSVVAFLDASTQNQPVVVTLSDLHWADPVVTELADTLLERLARRPFVLVATARQGIRERWNPSPGRHNMVRLNLDPLNARASAELLTSLMGGEPPADVAAALIERSGGNPFFLEELVSLVGERRPDAPVDAAARFDVSVPADVSALPDTLRGLVAARLDHLTHDERAVLTDAAVLGRRSLVEHLRRMTKEMGRPGVDVDAALAGLVAKDMLHIEDGMWSFRSEVVREVAYGTLTKLDRARRHAGIAHWIEEHHDGAERSDSVVARLARHYGVAAELVRELGAGVDKPIDVREKALHWIGEAADRARRSDVLPVAEQLYSQALELLGDERGERRLELLLGRSEVRADNWDVDGARVDADLALLEATELGHRRCAARALLRLGDLAQKAGDPDLAVSTLTDAAGRFAALGDDGGRGEALRLHGMTELFRGAFGPARATVSEALAAFRVAGSRSGEAWALQNLAWIAFMTGRTEEAEERLQESLTTFSDIGDTVGMAWALGLLAFVKFQQGNGAEASVLAREILDEARGRGDRWATGMMLSLVASIDLWAGRTDDAILNAGEAARVFAEVGDPFGRIQSLGPYARALVMAGRVAEGIAAFEQAVEIAAGLPGREATGLARGSYAGACVQMGDPARAVAQAGLEEQSFDAPTLGDGERLVTAGLARLQQGDVAGASLLVDRAAAGTDDTGHRPFPTSARALVLAAAGDVDGALAAAEQVPSHPAATYLDEATAGIAAGLALVQSGQRDAALGEIDLARVRVDATGDVLSQAVVRLAESVALQALGDGSADEVAADAAARFSALGIDGEGWRAAFALAAGAATSA